MFFLDYPVQSMSEKVIGLLIEKSDAKSVEGNRVPFSLTDFLPNSGLKISFLEGGGKSSPMKRGPN